MHVKAMICFIAFFKLLSNLFSTFAAQNRIINLQKSENENFSKIIFSSCPGWAW